MKMTSNPLCRPNQFNHNSLNLNGRVAWLLLAALLMICSIPAMATINVMTNNVSASLGTAANFSVSGITAAPTSNGWDISLEATNSTALTYGSPYAHAESWNVTNGLSYTICANSATQGPVIRFGENYITNAIPNGTNDQPFLNPFSGGTSDLLFLTNNSTLTIYGTNVSTGGSLINQLRSNGAFNIQPGSTLTINNFIGSQSS
jgi:hypothetical protein